MDRPRRGGRSGPGSGPPAGRAAAARDTVFLEDMTWTEVRDALAAGTATAVVPYVSEGQSDPPK